MDQKEFLDLLEEALREEMPEAQVQGNLNYYREYFLSERGRGRTEREIISELGSPRLIAKTLIESFKMTKMPWNREYQQQNSRRFDEDEDFTGQEPEERTGKRFRVHSGYHTRIPWHYRAGFLLVIILIIALVVAIGGFAISVFLSVGLPILLCLFFARLIWSVFRK